MLTPTQIQRMCTNYYVADYEVWAPHIPKFPHVFIESQNVYLLGTSLARPVIARGMMSVAEKENCEYVEQS